MGACLHDRSESLQCMEQLPVSQAVSACAGEGTRLFQNTDGYTFEHTWNESDGGLLRRNPWAAGGALLLQSLLLAALVVTPLCHSELPSNVPPKKEVLTWMYAPPLPPPPPAAANTTRVRTPVKTATHIHIPNPKAISIHKAQEVPPVPVAAVGGVAGGVPGGVVGGVVGGVPGGVPGGVLGGALNGTGTLPVLAETPTPPKKIHVAPHVAEGNLVHDVTPEYPPEAGRARIEGTVVLQAVIGKDGSVEDVQVKSGLPVLAQAAINAVRQWRYRPYLLNGEPIEVDTQITINFTLSAG